MGRVFVHPDPVTPADDAAARGVAQHWASPEWQRILNGHDVPPLSAQTDADPPIPIRARAEWGDGSVEAIETTALGWTSDLVRVEMYDRRWRLGAVWLGVGDVTKSSTPG